MAVLQNVIDFLKSDWYVVVLALIIIIGSCFLFFGRTKPVTQIKKARSFIEDFFLIFYGDNYSVTVWVTMFMVGSILIGLLGLCIGNSVKLSHSHWVVFEILLIWGIIVVALKHCKKTLWRSILFAAGSVVFLCLCFLLFDWPQKYTDRYGYIIGLASFLVSAIGIFISMRVFMQIDSQRKVNSVDNYLKGTISIIKNAQPGDEVYIMAPSFCVGMINSPYQLNAMYDLIEEKANSGILFHLAFPSIGRNRKKKSNNQSGLKLIDLRYGDDIHWKILCELLENTEIQSVYTLLDRIYYLNRSYYKRLVSLKKNMDIQWLDYKYIHQKKQSNRNTFSGFFATLNLGRKDSKENRQSGGDCYMGSFYVSNQELFFVGSEFNNPNVNSSILALWDSEINRYLPKEN